VIAVVEQAVEQAALRFSAGGSLAMRIVNSPIRSV